MNFSKKIEEVIKANSNKDFKEQVRKASVIDIPITEEQLKILVVIIENLAALTDQGLLELSDEEKTQMDSLYQNAVHTLDNWSQKESTQYVSQLDVMKRISNGKTTDK
jgi:hypothetical protein